MHQEALLAGDLSLALQLLETVEEGQREHIRVEEELLLPVYERAGRIPGGDTRFYLNEHRKMLTILEGFMQTLPHLIEDGPANARREIIGLFDQAYWFKRLLEHRIEDVLFPVIVVFEQVTGEAERRELLEKCSLE